MGFSREFQYIMHGSPLWLPGGYAIQTCVRTARRQCSYVLQSTAHVRHAPSVTYWCRSTGMRVRHAPSDTFRSRSPGVRGDMRQHSIRIGPLRCSRGTGGTIGHGSGGDK